VRTQIDRKKRVNPKSIKPEKCRRGGRLEDERGVNPKRGDKVEHLRCQISTQGLKKKGVLSLIGADRKFGGRLGKNKIPFVV